MNQRRLLFVFAVIGGCLATAAAPAQILESDWNAALTGAQSWQVNANWSTPAFPDDPGRVDSNMVVISDVVGANLSVALGGNLNLDVGATDVTVAGLRLGGTAGAVTTTVSAQPGGRLVFENNESNDNTDPDNVIPAYNFGRPLIVSDGVPGSTNIISAPIYFTEPVDVGSYGDRTTKNDLLISGPITFGGTEAGASLNMEAAGRTLTLTSDMVVDDVFTAAESNPIDFAFNSSTESKGTLLLEGVISGTGSLQIGPRPGSSSSSSAVISRANTFTGGFRQGKVTLTVANDAAFGTGTVRQITATNSLGTNLVSDNDNRVIANNMQLAQYVTIKGEHSLTWAGDVAQTNARGWINLLPEGKTFFLTGTQYADDQTPPDTGAIPGSDTQYFFDGSGKTVVTGALRDHADGEAVQRSFGKRGTGAVYLQGSVQGTPNLSSYSGFTYIQGGNLHLAGVAELGQTIALKSTGGAIGLDNGTVTGPDSASFLQRFNSRAQAPLTLQGDLKRTDDFASGGLMLTASESATNLNFTTGNLANAADMSVAAPEQGMTYTGTITPANATYRLGGGAGVITLPNANQLTGANSLVVMNGHDFEDRQGLGGVRITATNNYTGGTRIQGRSMNTNQDAAAVDGGVPAGGQYNGSTLTVTSLANGGVASGIGSSSSAAANLHLQGGTLRYEGAATTTDRLFTIGTRGATLDASGSGALVFSNAGALTIDTAEARSGVTSGPAFGFETGTTPASTSVAYNIADTSDLVPGMQIAGNFLTESASDDDMTITITGIQSPTRVQFSDPLGPFVNFGATPSTLTFIDVARTFTLTGSNTGNNVLKPIIADSPTNVVNLDKTGAGKWILQGANTYTGDTTIESGVLSITNSFLADAADVSIDAGAIFDLSFAGTDTIGALFLDGASKPMGTYGAIGSGAQFETSFLTGTGLLGVTAVVDSLVTGDYNNDGIVNAADYTVWRDNEGAAAGTLPNDLTGGTIGPAQYTQWKDNYGSTTPAAAALSAAVPEPTALLLATLTALAASCRRRGA
ncbi:Autotransporter-associated beta strand repeat protein [Botrimarina colliarenosi]|uniref:Autotransporter-associated beta strand repeat protein n=1 Tax=Botrimarina colliarenosi TaxID=2528001 RepID=A0A5C6AES0_9BACT|nr:autotransporter-associated beta strand repeat-containing protein [Botrimarina colliarenosi]TWT97675.1 Autotransporter-associated beta strand repeat protein [Botrimarina colliarenosi]